jgi:hypothetical protein
LEVLMEIFEVSMFGTLPYPYNNRWQLKKKIKRNFDSLEKEILTVWKGKFWQFGKGILWQFGKEKFDSLEREILTVFVTQSILPKNGKNCKIQR